MHLYVHLEKQRSGRGEIKGQGVQAMGEGVPSPPRSHPNQVSAAMEIAWSPNKTHPHVPVCSSRGAARAGSRREHQSTFHPHSVIGIGFRSVSSRIVAVCKEPWTGRW